ncbi:MAG: hypothetical protein ACP5UH_03490 [Candidatus Micrarchaeia archaeon]
MDIKRLFKGLLKEKRYVPNANDSRPVMGIRVGPNMWQLVYADEPIQYASSYRYEEAERQ